MKNQSVHARSVADRFRQMLIDDGASLNDQQVDELSLLIESALDAVVLEQIEALAGKLESMAHEMRHDEQFFC